MDRGSLVHNVLDEFLARGPGPTRGRSVTRHEPGPTPIGRASTRSPTRSAIGTRPRGSRGAAVFWDRDRRRILAELDRFLVADYEMRADYGYTTDRHRARVRSPRSERPAIELPLSDGRRLRFRGAADRVDATAAGEAARHRLQDREAVRSSATPTIPRRPAPRLQLPVYALAARQRVRGRATHRSPRPTGSSARAAVSDGPRSR